MNPQLATTPATKTRANQIASTCSASTNAGLNRTDSDGGHREPTLWTIFKRIHSDERGGVSIETILIIAAIALPILIFIIKFGWPRIRKFFNEGMDELEGGALDAAGGE